MAPLNRAVAISDQIGSLPGHPLRFSRRWLFEKLNVISLGTPGEQPATVSCWAG